MLFRRQGASTPFGGRRGYTELIESAVNPWHICIVLYLLAPLMPLLYADTHLYWIRAGVAAQTK
jgi:hypothetical protein